MRHSSRERSYGFGKQRVVDGPGRLVADREDDRLLEVEHVAGLRVEAGRVLRLKLVFGRRLDVVDQAPVARLDAIGRQPLRVGRPRDRVQFVAVGFRAVRAQDRRCPRARLADRDVEVGDEGLQRAVGRHARLRVGPGRRARRGRLALLERADCRRLRAGVVRERARPDRPVEARLDRPLVVPERERVERQRDRGDLAARHLRDRGREPLVIERRPLLSRVGVDEDELVAALHRPPVPEPVRLLDPGRRARHIERRGLVLLAQPGRALVVGGRHLRGARQRDRAEQQGDRDGEGAVLRLEHAGDSIRKTVTPRCRRVGSGDCRAETARRRGRVANARRRDRRLTPRAGALRRPAKRISGFRRLRAGPETPRISAPRRVLRTDDHGLVRGAALWHARRCSDYRAGTTRVRR